MDEQEIIVSVKRTKFEIDSENLNLEKTRLLDHYKSLGLNSWGVLESHTHQKESLSKLQELLKDAKFIFGLKMNKNEVKNAKMIISLGGDSHFLYAAKFAGSIPILGINSDPKHSVGSLNSITLSNSEDIKKLESIIAEKIKPVQWPRIETTLNGKKLEYNAVSDVFIGEKQRLNISKHILQFNGQHEHQKTSGLIISTGAGSTGWYNSACRHIFQKGDAFAKTSIELRFIASEPVNTKFTNYKLSNGSIGPNETLEVTNFSEIDPVLSFDALTLIPLKSGAKISVFMGKPLNVLT